jgi:hypothetical protein
MAPIKVYPPDKLPERGVTDLQFSVWSQELEIYIKQDARLSVFLPGKPYATWEAYEVNPDRIAEPAGNDEEAHLAVRQTELLTFLSLVAKACDINHYNVIMRHSTSLEWIYTRLREDYDIQQKGIHFFSIFDLRFQPGTSAVAFYNQYRNQVTANLKKQGDTIIWQNNTILEADERCSPTFEDMILANVLGLIDPRLPGHVRDHYHHLIGKTKSLMDYRTDILVKVPTFITEIEGKPQNSSLHCQVDEHLGAMRYQQPFRGRGNPSRGAHSTRYRGNGRGLANSTRSSFSSLYCRLCHVTGQPETVVRSHRTGDPECPKLSAADRTYIENQRNPQRLNAISQHTDGRTSLADEYGYDQDLEHEDSSLLDDQVRTQTTKTIPSPVLSYSSPTSIHRTSSSRPMASCNFIQPVPSQILTAFTRDKQPVHIELDSNATVNYITLVAAKSFGFHISPNSQLSVLADGITKLLAIGEINEIFSRNEWTVSFKAVVVHTLHTQLIGGTVFLKENAIKQDFVRNTIQVHGKYTVLTTSPAFLLPI